MQRIKCFWFPHIQTLMVLNLLLQHIKPVSQWWLFLFIYAIGFISTHWSLGRLSRTRSDLFLHLTEERRGVFEMNTEAVLLVLNSPAQAVRLTGKKEKSVHAGWAINSGSDKYLLSLPTWLTCLSLSFTAHKRRLEQSNHTLLLNLYHITDNRCTMK